MRKLWDADADDKIRLDILEELQDLIEYYLRRKGGISKADTA